MTEAEWLACEQPERLLAVLSEGRRVKPSGRKLRARASGRRIRLLTAHCCRNVIHDATESQVRSAIEVLESFADGEAAAEELRAAHRALVGRPPVLSLHTAMVGDAVQSAVFSAPVSERDTLIFTAREIMQLAQEAADLGGIGSGSVEGERSLHTSLVRDIFGNPFRPARVDPAWLTSTVTAIARTMYDSRDFSAMPILADALQDAGCDNDDILSHCRGEGPHVRGCWVVDLVLGKG